MVGCLGSVLLECETHGRLILVQLAHRSLEQVLGAYPVNASLFWTPPDFWDADDLALGLEDHPSVWTDGSGEDYPISGFEVAGAGVVFPAPEEAMREAVLGTTEEYGDARLERCHVFLCRSLVRSRRFSVLSRGVLFWLYKPFGLVILVLTTSTSSSPSVVCWFRA